MSSRDQGPPSHDARGPHPSAGAPPAPAAGKTSLVQRRYGLVQRRSDDASATSPPARAGVAPSAAMTADLFDAMAVHLDPVQRAAEAHSLGLQGLEAPGLVHAQAAHGLSGAATELPYADQIQRSFGAGHDVGGIRTHVGGPAAEAATAIGATAYATGDHVAFASAPDLHTAAHEAAHVVQQRAGVQLKGGVGQAGDPYEVHADAVADRVVSGQSAADLLAAGPGAAATPAVQLRRAPRGRNTPPMSSALLRSAATDLERLGARMALPWLPGGVTIADVLAEISAITRRIEHAGGIATEREDPEFENLAGAARAFIGNLPPSFAKAPEIQDAVVVLQEDLGLAMARTDFSPSAEPVRTLAPLDDAQQAQLARKLLADAVAWLVVANSAPPGRDESGLYRRNAVEAAEALRVVTDLIAGHVPQGKARVAFAESVLAASEEIALVDRWVRSMKLPADATFARLYAAERDLRALVGVEPVARAPMGEVDASTLGDRLIDEDSPEGPPRPRVGSFTNVANALDDVLESIRTAIDAFAAQPQSAPAPKDSSLTTALLNVAVEAALGGTFAAGVRKAAVAAGRALVGSESESEFPEKALAAAWKRGEDWLRSSGRSPVSDDDLHRGYVELLRTKFVRSMTEIRMELGDREEQLRQVNPTALAALAAHLREQSADVKREAHVQYVLAWQTLRARNDQGTPEAPRYGGTPEVGRESTNDAALWPAFTAGVPGVLHLHFAVDRAAPRSSTLVPGSASVEGMSAAHLEALRNADDRPLRQLGLNTSIRVTYRGSQLGGVDLLWFPDGGTVKVGWERMDWSRAQLQDARHLQAYAKGTNVDDPALETATHEDALAGAQMIADAVMAKSHISAFGGKR
jgi:hypothetical protein